MVVVGNPPYSKGQESQNDDNQNVKYQAPDGHVQATYAALSTATNKNSLYNSYIRAIRWASDRIKDEGVVAFVSNGGYIDDNTADGLRKSLVQEFDVIYCYNLRGNQRTAGEQSRKEGGKIFGSGSRNTVAILILVKGAKDPASTGCTLRYRDIGDYLTREDKLRVLGAQDLESVPWQEITPNPEGDWINQRDQRFAGFQPIAGEGGSSLPSTPVAWKVVGMPGGTAIQRLDSESRSGRRRRDPDRRRVLSPAGLAHSVAAQPRQGGPVSDHVHPGALNC